uniref:DUF834 domain-containing protein n=1 Tax=Oryza barthii TaxID=65489 RepID=A0A0D3F7V7_9ORYZ
MGTMGGSWPESAGRGGRPEMREVEAVDQRKGKVTGRLGMEGEAVDKSKPAGKGIIPCDWQA